LDNGRFTQKATEPVQGTGSPLAQGEPKQKLLNYTTKSNFKFHTRHVPSLAWPDPFHAAAYPLEIISIALQESGTGHELKRYYSLQWLVSLISSWDP